MGRKFKIILFIHFLFGLNLVADAQINPIPIGTWRSHFDYTKGKCLTKVGNKVFCAAENGFFVFDIADNEATTLSTDDGFSSLNISQMAYHEVTKTLVIAHKNGSIDLAKLDANNEISDVNTILNIKISPSILDSKATSQITFNNNIAFLATDFGIVQIDLAKKLIKEVDLNIGTDGAKISITSIAFWNGKIYASSNKYLLESDFNDNTNLQNFESWKQVNLPNNILNGEGTFNKVAVFDNKLIIAVSGKGLYLFNNKNFTEYLKFNDKLLDISGQEKSLYICFNNKISYVNNSQAQLNFITDPLIKLPQQVVFDNQKIWIADNKNGLISNTTNTFAKYNPTNSPGLLSSRNDSIVTDFTGITWTRLAAGNGLQISDNQGNKKNFSRIPLVDNNNRFANYTVNSIAVDKNKNYSLVYAATDAGVVAINSNTELFKAENLDAYITTPRIDGGRILQNEIVLSIAIDGGNRKWFGTSSGLFLFNDDVNKILEKFTNVNSPLPSNKIDFLNLEPKSGEMFIYTPNGIVSYRTGATESTDIQENNVLVFPNPIKPDFDGLVGISGLVTNAFVKILDISGRLVYQTRANGGTATWNITAQNGRRAESGIYYIFSGNEFGQETMVTKVAVIK